MELKPILEKCWEHAPSARTPALTAITTLIPIYVSLTEKGFNFDLPSGSEHVGIFVRTCAQGLLLGAPNMLSGGQIKLTRFYYEKSPMVFKVGLSVVPDTGHITIPGTSIGKRAKYIDVYTLL